MKRKTNNLVAKHASKFNKATIQADRKRKSKDGYIKHKNRGYGETVSHRTFNP